MKNSTIAQPCVMNYTQGVRGVFDEQGHRGSLGCIVSGQVWTLSSEVGPPIDPDNTTETGLGKSNSSFQSLESNPGNSIVCRVAQWASGFTCQEWFNWQPEGNKSNN